MARNKKKIKKKIFTEVIVEKQEEKLLRPKMNTGKKRVKRQIDRCMGNTRANRAWKVRRGL